MDVKKISEKFPNIWKLYNILLNSSLIKEEMREIRNYFELNENENTTHHHSWNTDKAVLSGKFIALKAYIMKESS